MQIHSWIKWFTNKLFFYKLISEFKTFFYLDLNTTRNELASLFVVDKFKNSLFVETHEIPNLKLDYVSADFQMNY